MPRDSAGNFTLVPGNPVQSGTVVSSTWANSTLDDVSTALTDSLDRYGRGGMLAPFKFSDGTNLLPGAAWVNEPTTGFYRFDAGDLRAVVLTQDVMRWRNSGAQVWNTTDSQWENILSSNTNSTAVPDGTAEGQTLRWNNTGSEWEETSNLVVASSGDVGIGSSATTNRRLTVESGVAGLQMLVQSTAAESGIAFNDSGSSNTFGTRLGSKADDLTFTTNGSERMRIDSSGNVGIGDTNPSVPLSVEKDTSTLARFTRNSDVAVSLLGSLQVPTVSFKQGAGDSCIGSRAPDELSFHVESDTASLASERMRINTTATFVEGGYSELDRVAGTKNLAGTSRIYRFITLSQSDYDGLTNAANTLYIIV